jgi:hypothetical protein
MKENVHRYSIKIGREMWKHTQITSATFPRRFTRARMHSIPRTCNYFNARHDKPRFDYFAPHRRLRLYPKVDLSNPGSLCDVFAVTYIPYVCACVYPRPRAAYLYARGLVGF